MDKQQKQSSNILQSVADRLSRFFRKGNESSANASDKPQPSNDETKSAEKSASESTSTVRIVTKKYVRHQHKKNDESHISICDISPEQVADVIANYVLNKLSDPEFGVEMMANNLQTSRTGLYQIMHREFSQTPATYILDQRLKLAEEMLRNGRTTRETSLKCGFSDPKYFSKVFKKYFGVLPSNYYSTINQDSKC